MQPIAVNTMRGSISPAPGNALHRRWTDFDQAAVLGLLETTNDESLCYIVGARLNLRVYDWIHCLARNQRSASKFAKSYAD